MTSLDDYCRRQKTDAERVVLCKQWEDAVVLRTIDCAGCQRLRAVECAYRCLYCGGWFCVSCAEIHFGQTVLDWVIEKRVEVATAFEKKT